jgi:hypothetical protein
MKMYIIAIICILLGFLLPPLGGYEQILLIVGAYIFFKKLKENYEK